jgi:large subunit ribosomal protein L3
MARGILARKIGMTQMFVDDRAVGVTVVESQPSVVVRVKTVESDGYAAIQLGYDEIPESKASRPMAGHFKKAGVAPHRHVYEVRVDRPEEYSIGDRVGVDIFAEGETIDISGVSKGLGFQGVVRRWGFAGGPSTHGSHFHRRPGSVGQCVKPGRVVKGRKLPGHMGSRRVSVRGVKVLRVEPERNLLVLKGAAPGARGTLLELGKRNG